MPALNHTRYRARLRGHDELRRSLPGEGRCFGGCKMRMRKFEFSFPSSMAEALKLLAQNGSRAKVIAGGWRRPWRSESSRP